MANLIYMTLNGEKQGFISQNCGTYSSMGNKYQALHKDQIFVLALTCGTHREQHINHQPVTITKPIDKSSPLLGIAISNNENLQCLIEAYRTSASGLSEKFYSIELKDAHLADISINFPHAIDHNDAQPEETLILSFKSITWQHHLAGTSGYSIWEENVY
ncbi:Hcp family type VI secretion system effector [Buttiauxella sp. WJP83]|uniref:Hcp family type VI secretion system effector n=1 Tax=Buttiauxella sp. WJP83 TaxID=2986951 RepID=UPI0022DD0F71|nr:Hcp family type VI secretion system effector [Buttiauxella sp. WJP83]WBM71314.1 Hcp family type VI secretion system effector [Buttiauxella sp. WJP83]